MADAPPTYVIRDNVEKHRFEVDLGDGSFAVAEYTLPKGKIMFTHTEVPPKDEAKGFASRLVGAALADAHKRGFKIVPACSFVVAYVRRHPEYDDR